MAKERSGLAIGLNRGHVRRPIFLPPETSGVEGISQLTAIAAENRTPRRQATHLADQGPPEQADGFCARDRQGGFRVRLPFFRPHRPRGVRARERADPTITPCAFAEKTSPRRRHSISTVLLFGPVVAGRGCVGVEGTEGANGGLLLQSRTLRAPRHRTPAQQQR